MKSCSKCGTTKDINLFVRSTSSSTGWGAHCLECDRERVRARRNNPEERARNRVYALAYRQGNLDKSRALDLIAKRDRQKWLNTFKCAPCADCGKKYPPCCMDFDHIGKKTKGIGQLLSSSTSRILTELGKCELVCACCHRVRTKSKLWGDTSNRRRRKHYQKINALKAEPCVDCGVIFPPEAMDFDHVRGNKVMTVSQLRDASWRQTLLEMDKCELVCACCHRVRTQLRTQKSA
jgi:hypothetical protein